MYRRIGPTCIAVPWDSNKVVPREAAVQHTAHRAHTAHSTHIAYHRQHTAHTAHSTHSTQHTVYTKHTAHSLHTAHSTQDTDHIINHGTRYTTGRPVRLHEGPNSHGLCMPIGGTDAQNSSCISVLGSRIQSSGFTYEYITYTLLYTFVYTFVLGHVGEWYVLDAGELFQAFGNCPREVVIREVPAAPRRHAASIQRWVLNPRALRSPSLRQPPVHGWQTGPACSG